MQDLPSRQHYLVTPPSWTGASTPASTETPAVFRSIEPAWNDRNLREVAGHVHSPLFLAHIRASTGTAVQQTNCHPFRHGKWLWVHNGLVHDFPSLSKISHSL